MKKFSFKNHIQNNFKWYFLGIIVAFVVSLLSITIAAAPTKKEKIAILLTCYSTDSSLSKYMESIKPDYLETIELNVRHKEDTYYGTVIKGYRNNADVLIVPESKIDYIILKNCLVLNNDFVNELTTSDFDYYTKDDVNYGLKIYSKDTKKGLLDGLVIYNKEDNDEDCYLFININSYHLGKYNDSKYDGLISILKEILNYEKENS